MLLSTKTRRAAIRAVLMVVLLISVGACSQDANAQSASALKGPVSPLYGQTVQAFGKVYDIALSPIQNISGATLTIKSDRVVVHGPIHVEDTFLVFRQKGFASAGGGVTVAPLPVGNRVAHLIRISTQPRLVPHQLVYVVVRARLTNRGAGELVGVAISYEEGSKKEQLTVKVPWSLCAAQTQDRICESSLKYVRNIANQT